MPKPRRESDRHNERRLYGMYLNEYYDKERIDWIERQCAGIGFTRFMKRLIDIHINEEEEWKRKEEQGVTE